MVGLPPLRIYRPPTGTEGDKRQVVEISHGPQSRQGIVKLVPPGTVGVLPETHAWKDLCQRLAQGDPILGKCVSM